MLRSLERRVLEDYRKSWPTFSAAPSYDQSYFARISRSEWEQGGARFDAEEMSAGNMKQRVNAREKERERVVE